MKKETDKEQAPLPTQPAEAPTKKVKPVTLEIITEVPCADGEPCGNTVWGSD